jgi:hypothetical protein
MNQKKSLKMRRPAVATHRKRSVQVSVAMTKQEYKLLRVIAKEQGLSISELLMHKWRNKKAWKV